MSVPDLIPYWQGPLSAWPGRIPSPITPAVGLLDALGSASLWRINSAGGAANTATTTPVIRQLIQIRRTDLRMRIANAIFLSFVELKWENKVLLINAEVCQAFRYLRSGCQMTDGKLAAKRLRYRNFYGWIWFVQRNCHTAIALIAIEARKSEISDREMCGRPLPVSRRNIHGNKIMA